MNTFICGGYEMSDDRLIAPLCSVSKLAQLVLEVIDVVEVEF